MKKIRKILIANRGEIAVRIINAANEWGIATAAVYSDTDRVAMHVRLADEVYRLEKKENEPYLDIDAIIGAAKKAEVDAIHPGYGFLSENHRFAKAVEEAGLIFIGPPANAIKMMGDKLIAKDTAIRERVPVIPGFLIEEEITPEMKNKAAEIGYPLLIKARAGGGGKGMRVVWEPDLLEENIGRAVSEAREAFGDGSVFVEKYIQNPRHIEFQILADQHGNIVHLFERECSVQRRHQKVIEEAPSVVLDESLRRQMGEAAVKLARACGYINAGTVEFMVDSGKNYYFLEVNTRLQVEHPVTEFITGLDLVKEQIRIAEGQPLGFTQDDLTMNGHAIELRIYAEDPRNNFLPDTGDLNVYRPPKGPGIRVDDGYEEGMEIPMEYDPLIGKMIVHAQNRTEAIARMKRAIRQFHLSGVKNTLDFGLIVMENEEFATGRYDTGFVNRNREKITLKSAAEPEAVLAAILGTDILTGKENLKTIHRNTSGSKWRHRLND